MQNRFQMTPDSDALNDMPRDLRFHPSTTSHPTYLSPARIDQFNQDGYLAPFRVFDTAAAAEVRSYFDRLLEQALATGGDSYSISTAHLKHGGVYDLLKHDIIVSLVRDILGNDVIGWGSHFFCKLPGDGKSVAWHQDASYWPLTPSKTVTVWLAIDDADTENGCMRFLAGSHRFGHLTYRDSGDDEHNVLNQTVDDAERYGTPVDNVLRAGECSVHSDLLLHGSEANRSHRRRCGLTLRYCTPDVRAGQAWEQKGVVVSGSDPGGYWANPARPSSD